MTLKKNYDGILLEEMNDSIKLLAEVQIGIRDNVEKLAKTQNEMKDDISVLKGDVSILKSDVSMLKGDVSMLKGDVSMLKGDVSMLKGDVSILKSDVAEIKTDLAEFKEDTKEKFDLVMTYLMRIEEELVEIRKEIAGIKDGSIPVGNMVDVEERVTFLEGEVTKLKAV